MLDMLKVVDTLKVGNLLSVTVEGDLSDIKNNASLIDENGFMHTVKSVGLENLSDPHDISRIASFLTELCELKIGTLLFRE